jgi:hypothetical protein
VKIGIRHITASAGLVGVANWIALIYLDQGCEPTPSWCHAGTVMFALFFIWLIGSIMSVGMIFAQLIEVVRHHFMVWTAVGAAYGLALDALGVLDKFWTPQFWRTSGDLYGPWYGAVAGALCFALAFCFAVTSQRSGKRSES